MRAQGYEKLSLLPERAPSEGPRSTAAVGPATGALPGGTTSELGGSSI